MTGLSVEWAFFYLPKVTISYSYRSLIVTALSCHLQFVTPF
jgi:hypothetical protein